MGLSIYYNGKFNPAASLSAMIVEVEDVAKIYGWRYRIFGREFPENSLGKTEYNQLVYGICFSPPECEPVYLSFLSNGRMSSPDNLRFRSAETSPERAGFIYLLSTKTQYAGVQVHMVIIQLLKYLSKKYFLELKLTDEGQYWETGDENLLKEIFAQYNAMMDSFANALETIPQYSDETIEEFIGRIAEYIRKKRE